MMSFWDINTQLMVAETPCVRPGFLAIGCNPLTGTFVTCGAGSIAFWTLADRNVDRKKGIVDGGATLLALAFLGATDADNIVVAGSEDGALHTWVETPESLRAVPTLAVVEAHKAAVLDLSPGPNGTLASVARDGSVRLWSHAARKLTCVRDFVLQLPEALAAAPCAACEQAVCVRAACWLGAPGGRAGTAAPLLVGLGSNTLAEAALGGEVAPEGGAAPGKETMELRVAVEGHTRGRITAIAAHPGREVYATAGDDRTVKLWVSEQRAVVQRRTFPAAAAPLALAFSPDGAVLLTGCADGSIHAAPAHDIGAGGASATFRCSRQKVLDLQISPDNTMLAVACADRLVHVFAVRGAGGAARSLAGLLTPKGTCRGHAGTVLRVDWSLDSSRLQSESDAYDTILWDMGRVDSAGRFAQARSAQEHADLAWATRRCLLTWHASGLHSPSADLYRTLSLGRSMVGSPPPPSLVLGGHAASLTPY